MLPAIQNNQINRSVLKTPQGIVGTALAVAALVAFGIYLAPLILAAITNMLMLGVVLGLTFLVLGTLYTMRVPLWYGYLIYVRKAINAIVRIEPIAVMKIYIGKLRQRIRVMEEQITKLSGAVRNLEDEFEENRRAMIELKNQHTVALQHGDKGQAQVYMNDIGRLKESNDDYLPLILQLKNYVMKLDDMKEGAGLMIQDMANDIKHKEKKYNAIKNAHGAIKSAQAIFEGNPDERAMFEEALEIMKMDMSNRIAEFDRIMKQNETTLKTLSIQKGVRDLKGMQVLEELEQGNFDYLLKPLATRIEDIEAEKVPVTFGTKNETLKIRPIEGNKYNKYLE